MKTLESFLIDIEQRKVDIGLVETQVSIDAMRNKGGRRTDAKRELLNRSATRAKAAGQSPVVAYR